MPEIIIFFAFITTVLWLIIGWRAMRAHERIATSVANYVDSREHDLSAQFRSEAGQPIRRFREFVAEEPSRADLSPKDRHDAFRQCQWSDARD